MNCKKNHQIKFTPIVKRNKICNTHARLSMATRVRELDHVDVEVFFPLLKRVMIHLSLVRAARKQVHSISRLKPEACERLTSKASTIVTCHK